MKLTRLIFCLAAVVPGLAAADPQYRVTDLGTFAAGVNSLAYGISSNGLYVTGRTYAGSSDPGPAFEWSAATGSAALGTLAGRNYGWGYGVNDSGVAVGVAATTISGSNPLPVMWVGGSATALTLPTGQNVGRAYDINDSGIAVGSVGSGVSEIAAIYDTRTGTSSLITATTAGGAYMATAWAISGNGLVAGAGVDSSQHNVALVYDIGNGTMTQLAMPDYVGINNSIAFDISDDGRYVVGTSGNLSQAFIWSVATGALVAPEPTGGSGGILRGVNDLGQATGTFSGLYANPGLYANGQSYGLGDLVVNGAGWNFNATTSASAQDIAADGSIVGWALYDGNAHAFLLTPVPEPASVALMAAGLIAVVGIARRRTTEAARSSC